MSMSILCGCFSGECRGESMDGDEQVDGKPMRGECCITHTTDDMIN